MATAKLHDGRAIVAYNAQGKAIDSEGAVIPGAPKPPKDTDPSKQPGAAGAATPEERIGVAIAAALAGKIPASAAGEDSDDETDDEEADGLPSLAEMKDYLAVIDSAEEIKELRKSDKRKGAKPLYKARLDELEG